MRGQISIEFMIFVTILALIVIALLWNNLSLQNRMIGIKTNVEAQKLSDSIAFEINAAVKAGDGYERDFYVENSFFGISNFNISVEEYYASIDWSERSVSSRIITKNITGTISKGWNQIKNVNGEIIVS